MVYDVIQRDGILAYAMELVDGEDLGQLIDREGPMPEEELERLLSPVLDALEYIHDQGMVHRDVKPDNIIVCKDGNVKLADLGLAATVVGDENLRLTHSGVMMGTPAYMAPEQARDARRVDARADIYAWAATAYHAFAGQPPYDGVSAVDVILKATNQPLIMPDCQLSSVWKRVLRTCLAADPENRPANISTLRHYLEGQIEEPMPNWAKIALIATATVLVLSTLTFFYQQRSNASEHHSNDITVLEDAADGSAASAGTTVNEDANLPRESHEHRH